MPVDTDDGRFISITKGNFTDTLTDSRPTSHLESAVTYNGDLDVMRDDDYVKVGKSESCCEKFLSILFVILYLSGFFALMYVMIWFTFIKE